MIPSYRRLVLTVLLSCTAQSALALGASVGVGEAPAEIKDQAKPFQDDREKALDFDPGTAAKAAPQAAPSKAPAAAKSKTAPAPAPKAADPYRFKSNDDDRAPAAPVPVVAKFGSDEKPVPLTFNDGVLYAGAQVMPLYRATRLFVRKGDADMIRRMIDARIALLKKEMRGTRGGVAQVLETRLKALESLTVVAYDLP